MTNQTLITIIFFLISFIPCIYFITNPRAFRRLSQQKVNFIQEDERGRKNVIGYIQSWSVYSRLIMPKNDEQTSQYAHTVFVIIEPADPHPELGYQNVIVEVQYVVFL